MNGMGKNVTLDMTVENSLPILRLWKTYASVGDGSSPVVVFGDRKIIMDQVYTWADDGGDKKFCPSRDAKKFQNEAYKKELAKLYFRAIPDLYGAYSLRGAGDFNMNQKTYEDVLNVAKLTGIPVFRMNVANPNITSLSLDMKDRYFASITAALAEHIFPLNPSDRDWETS